MMGWRLLGLLFIGCLSGQSHSFDVPSGLVHLAIGATSGSVGALSAYPLDYVKSQLQTPDGRAKYSDGLDAFKDIIRSSPFGPLALYRGALVNVLGIMPEKTIKLGMNDFLKGCFFAHFGCVPLVGEVLAGAGAGLCQVIATNPLEVVKIKLQTGTSSVWEVLKEVGNLSKLYQGAEACIVRDVVFSALLFPTYTHAKVMMPAILTALTGIQDITPFWSDLVAGSVAAAPAAFIATPADTVKTRMQQAKLDTPETDDIPGNAFQLTKSIVSNEGYHVLFSGWFERVIRSVPQFGVTLALFDVLTVAAVNGGLL